MKPYNCWNFSDTFLVRKAGFNANLMHKFRLDVAPRLARETIVAKAYLEEICNTLLSILSQF